MTSFLPSLFGRPRQATDVFRDPGAMRDAYDVVVVGGGVRALAAARACAVIGADVALLAPGEIAAAPDERAWPVLRSARPDRLRAVADAESPRLLRQVAREFHGSAGAERTGALTLSEGRDDLETLSVAAQWLKGRGAQAWMVPGREVEALSPPLGAGAKPGAALYEPGALTIDSDALALGLGEAAAAHGAELFAFAPVTAIERDGPAAVGVRLDDRLVKADAIVLADDFAAIRLIREGKGRLSLTRDERVALVTAAAAPTIGPALAIGNIRMSRNRAGAVTASGPRGADALARRLVTLAPSLTDLTISAAEPLTAWTGVDGLPQVGAAEIPSLWLALGFGRDALSLALPAAECLAAQIAGRRWSPAFEPFAPTRRPGVRALEAAR